MRIVIDMQGAQSIGSRSRGIGRYTRSLAKAIIRNRGGHEVLLALNGLFPETIEPIRAAFAGLLPQDNIRVWQTMGRVSSNDVNNEWRRQVAELTREAFLESCKPDIVLLSSLFEGFVDDAITSVGLLHKNVPTAIILFDLIPLIYRDVYLKDPATETWYERKLEDLQRADLLLAISESSRQESIRYLGFAKKFSVNISTAAHPRFKPMIVGLKQEEDIRQRYNLQKPFVLYTGGIDWRKNIEGLIRAYAQLPVELRAKYQLAIVCNIQTEEQEKLDELARNSGLDADELVLTGFVSDNDLVVLYNLCRLFVFPSWHEGFGLPVLEAMSCGKAVIGSNVSSIPEVIGDEKALFDPRSDEDIASKLKLALTDDMFRGALERQALQQAQKFTWDKSAIRSISAMELCHTRHQQQVAAGLFSENKPRLAFVSPLPPERSGISYYSADLLPELSRHYEIDVIVAQETVADPWVNANCTIRDEQWLRLNAEKYDRVLYQFGNSSFHQHMFNLLAEVPGAIVLHDFFLSGIVSFMDGQGAIPNGFLKELYTSHGYQAVDEYFRLDNIDSLIKKYPCNLTVLQSSLGCIVHSEYAKSLAKHWYGTGDEEDWAVIPLLRSSTIRFDRDEARESLQLGPNDFVICCFGFIHPIKLNHRLLDAWLKSSLGKNKNNILVFVGGEPHRDYYELLFSTIRDYGLKNQIEISELSSRVRITGYVDSNTFNSYLTVADIGVQLRTDSRGETSAAVFDCMNYGLPVIINANGSMADLPSDAVWKLPDKFGDEQLIEALEVLQSDAFRRSQLSKRGRKIVQACHNSSFCADKYYKAIEGFYNGASNVVNSLTREISKIGPDLTSPQVLLSVAESINSSIPPKFSTRQLLVDISGLISGGPKDAFQRIGQDVFMEWLVKPFEGFRIEPVYATTGTKYRYARQFIFNFLGCQISVLPDSYIEYRAGDVFLGLFPLQSITEEHQGFYQQMRRMGVLVKHVVSSPQPAFEKETFSEEEIVKSEKWLVVVAECDEAICTSKAGAKALQAWFDEQERDRLSPFKISVSLTGIPGRHSLSA